MDAYYACCIAILPPSPSRALCILISSTGRSLLSVRTASKRCTVFMPDDTRPNMVCLPSRKGVGAYEGQLREIGWGLKRLTQVIKNCDPDLSASFTICRATKVSPFVFGPEFAMANIPAPTNRSSGLSSSANLSPYTDVPPRPVPVGSPPCIIKPWYVSSMLAK